MSRWCVLKCILMWLAHWGAAVWFDVVAVVVINRCFVLVPAPRLPPRLLHKKRGRETVVGRDNDIQRTQHISRVVLHNPNESSLSLSSTGGSIRRRRDNKKIKTWKRVRVQVNQFCDTEEEWKTKFVILCYMRFTIYYHMQWLDNSSYNQAMTKEVTCSQLGSTCGVLKGPVRWYWTWVSESRHLESINNSQAP